MVDPTDPPILNECKYLIVTDTLGPDRKIPGQRWEHLIAMPGDVTLEERQQFANDVAAEIMRQGELAEGIGDK
jgi:hypothetical protein